MSGGFTRGESMRVESDQGESEQDETVQDEPMQNDPAMDDPTREGAPWAGSLPSVLTEDASGHEVSGGRVGRLLRKGVRSLRDDGVAETFRRTVSKVRRVIFGEPEVRLPKPPPAYTDEDLAAQRCHVFPQKVTFSIVVPLFNTPEPYLRAMIDSVIDQTYPDWELCMADGSDAEHADVETICQEYVGADQRIRYQRLERNLGISGNTNACLAMATGDYVGLFDHDDLLHPAALYECMRAICERDADFVYTDESTFHLTPEDAYLPHFKPDFAPDNLRANNYICHFTVFRRTLLDEVGGGFDPTCDGAQDHDMILRLTEHARGIVHIPVILYYWRAHPGSTAESAGVKPYAIEAGIRSVGRQLERLGLRGEVSPVRPGLTIYRVRYEVVGSPKVSILIPNRDHCGDLRRCLDSIFKRTTYPNYEVVIVENGSTSPEIFAYYDELQAERDDVRVLSWDEARRGQAQAQALGSEQARGFNYSALNNFGAQGCTGDYLLLLNNDTEVITADWLQEMLMYAQRDDVGAVGAMLYYSDNTVQHAGVGLGLIGLAGHYFRGISRGEVGYVGRMLYAQDVTAVTGACLMMRRDVWDEVGGLDESFAVAFNDIDLCMRIRKTGRLIVWTPFAELYHYESRSRGSDDTQARKRRFDSEVARFRTRWQAELAAGDPYYNPNLTLSREDFAIATNPPARA